MFAYAFAAMAKSFRLFAGLALALSTAAASAQDRAGFTERLRPRIQVADAPQTWTLDERMAHYGVPGVALAIIENGEIVHAAGYGVLQAGAPDRVDADTVFSAGSVSKIATATLILRLVEAGYLDLDADALTGVTSWSLPAARDTAAGTPVPLRAILSHTAGFNLHGFADFPPGAELPDTVETLNGSMPAVHEALARQTPSGERYRYSGGGYTLAQLLVSDVMGRPFADVAAIHLFEPLGMTRSTFANPLPEDFGNIARAHNASGEPAALPRGYEAMPEAAASGLWTSARDLGRLTAALIGSYRGSGHALAQPRAVEMMTRVAPGEHGLGPRLAGRGEDFIFHHGGANNSYRAWIEGHLTTGDGLVILTNGTQGRALIDEIRNAVADTMGWALNRPVLAPAVAPDIAVLEAYAGTYTVDPDFPLAVRQQMVGWIFESDVEVGLRTVHW
jgi:CubicO group peptidase (beta-lactamase class C family)